MVGPGTGLAPFRSIIQHRILSNQTFGPLVLFFGCRNKSKDFHCQVELEKMASSGHLLMITAFSRDQEDKM
jgi:sulfite reductase alpha subunit-like flavoprotein